MSNFLEMLSNSPLRPKGRSLSRKIVMNGGLRGIG